MYISLSLTWVTNRKKEERKESPLESIRSESYKVVIVRYDYTKQQPHKLHTWSLGGYFFVYLLFCVMPFQLGIFSNNPNQKSHSWNIPMEIPCYEFPCTLVNFHGDDDDVPQ